jgi:autotransporter-associated beta strand protein
MISAHVLCLALGLQLLQSAGAVDGTWTNVGGGSWSATGNWDDNLIATGIQAGAGFNSVDLTTSVTVTLDGVRTVGNLVFADSNPSHDWFLRRGTGGVITLGVASGMPAISVENQSATLSVELAGNKGFSKCGPGTLVLTGVNTYSGPTLVACGTLRLGAPPAFPSGLKIMPLGDSITMGHTEVTAGYREPLYNMLGPLAANFQFIGTSSVHPGTLPSGPIDQRRHEGHSSYTIQNVNNNLDGYDDSTYSAYGGVERNPNGGFWFTGGNGTGRGPMVPDIITMMLGTNDLGNQIGVEFRLYFLISKITTQRPNAKLLVAKITPIPSHPAVDSYNEVVSQVVAGFQAAGKNVYLVDLNTHFPANGLASDGVHPSAAGFQWLAMQWHEAIIGAYSPPGGQTGGIPAASAVSVVPGATLELNGTRASMASLSAFGNVDLGGGGELTAATIHLNPGALLKGSGTLHGNVIHNGGGIGLAGESLIFDGQVTNNGTIDSNEGAALHFGGDFVNNGTFATGSGQTATFSGNFINNGVLRVTDGASLQAGGTFINNGTLDIISGAQDLAVNFVNNGLVVDATVVRTHSVSTSGNTITVTIQSHTGHLYQLQHSQTLEAGSWVDAGAPQAGATGTLLPFTAIRTSSRGFYRIRVSP